MQEYSEVGPTPRVSSASRPFVFANQSLGTEANGEVVATEIIRTGVGSLGLPPTVPFTTWLAAKAVRHQPNAVPSDDWSVLA